MKQLKLLIHELENKVPSPLLIFYNENEELEGNDLQKILDFLNNISSEECSLILSGDGGDFDSAITLGVYLKDRFGSKLETYIPKQASSAFGYIVLLSNRAHCCTDEPLSQIDLIFNKGGERYRAKRELKNKNQAIQEDAKFMWRALGEVIENILSRADSLYPHKVTNSVISKVMNLCMRDDKHQKPIRLSKLKDLKFNIDTVDKDIGKILTKLNNEVQTMLKKEDSRFMIASNNFILRY